MQYTVADSHTHIYPDAIAEKARKSIFDFYEFPYTDAPDMGTASYLKRDCLEHGITRALVCSVATAPRVVEHINEFILATCQSDPGFFVPFCSLHPDCEKKYELLASCREQGFRGLKLHPDIQKFYLDSPACDEIYAACSDLELPILMHCGDPRTDFSSPERIAGVMRRYPKLRLMAAHFGGFGCWERSYRLLEFDNIIFDTSSGIRFMDRELVYRFFEKFGRDKFLFGSDYPLIDPHEELEHFLALGMDEDFNRAVLWENFRKLFG